METTTQIKKSKLTEDTIVSIPYDTESTFYNYLSMVVDAKFNKPSQALAEFETMVALIAGKTKSNTSHYALTVKMLETYIAVMVNESYCLCKEVDNIAFLNVVTQRLLETKLIKVVKVIKNTDWEDDSE